MDGCSEVKRKIMDDFDDEGRSVSDVDFFDWEQIVQEAEENGEDDDSDISFDMEGVEEVPTDDEFEYVSEEDIDSIASIEMKPEGYKPANVAPPNNELSEDSKALLLWRDEEDEKSFSDWRITVKVEKTDDCSEEKATTYNVHRFALSTGPKQSGYFKALLQSDSFSENSDGMSTVMLPEEIAAHFPDFLDYLYAQPLESKFIIKFENWKSMIYLANYFLVPRLTEEVAEFIEKDMEYFNVEHMENYISEFNRDISEDMSRRILFKAVCVCAEMIQSIEVDSPLLLCIPPAMFRSIIWRLRYDDDDRLKTFHVSLLTAAYLEHNVEDVVLFSVYFCDILRGRFFSFLDHISCDSAIDLALTWYRLLEQKGWNDEHDNYDYLSLFECVKDDLEYIITDHLRHSETPSLEMMERLVREAPSDVVAKYFRESVDEAGLAAKNIRLVQIEARCSRKDAVKALKENDNKTTKAIRFLTSRRRLGHMVASLF